MVDRFYGPLVGYEMSAGDRGEYVRYSDYAALEASFVDRIEREDRESATLRQRIDELERALGFYADVSKYPAPFTGGMGALWSDCGQIARAALGRKA